MANTKKYVSFDKLGLYDEKIKKLISDADTAALDSAKAYADGLAGNYEAAGSIATAQAALQKNIDAAQAAADKAQGEVDALETLVGVLPEGTTATSVVAYIDAKTANVASDETVSALAGRVTQAENDIDAIEADYLKAADKTELNDAIVAEADRAKGIEGGLETRLAAVEADYLKGADKTELQGNIDVVAGNVATIAGDYLKAADKTELQGKIDLKVAQADFDAKMEEIDGDIDGLQTQINTIMNNPDTEKVVDSINEFTAWIDEHGGIADGMRADIDKNKEDIAAEAKRAGEAEVALAGRLDVLEAIDHDAYVDADTALKNELNGEIAKKADDSALTSAVEALQGADSAMAGRLDAIEAQLGDGEGSVADMIADAKAEAIAAAAQDAATKDEAVLAAAKKYADDEDALIEARVATLETASATHALKTEVEAVAGRVTTVEGKVSTLETEMDAVEALAAANEAAIGTLNTTVATKAAQTDLTAVGDRVTAIENWHANFVEVSEEEINSLFQ